MKKANISHILIIIATVCIAFCLTLRMYFWQDDFALLFKMQNPIENSGSFGPGVFGTGAYKYLATPFILAYPIFGDGPLLYFAVGIITYILAAVVFYFLAKQIFKNEKAAFFASLIFSTGYIGSESMFRVINSWQTNFGLILTLTTLLFYIKSKTEVKTLKYYLLALFFYFLAIEFVLVRSHGLILPILVGEFLYSKKYDIKKIIISIFKIAPFLALFVAWYEPYKIESGGGNLTLFIKNLLAGKADLIPGPIASIGNLFIPDIIQQKLLLILGGWHSALPFIIIFISFVALFYSFNVNKKYIFLGTILIVLTQLFNLYLFRQNFYWYRTPQAVFAGSIGFLILSFFGVLSLSLWKQNKPFAKAIIFSFSILLAVIIGYNMSIPTSIFHTTQRYLPFALIGLAIIYGGMSYIKGLPFFMTIFIPLLFLNIKNQAAIVKERSIPAKKFYSDLINFVPKPVKNSIFYFDVANESQYQFSSFFGVGSMPETTAIAVQYKIDRYDLFLPGTYNELLNLIKEDPKRQNNLYTFFYDKNGLIKTAIQDKSVSPISPILLTARLRITPESVNSKYDSMYIDYLLSRKDYYKSVKVESLSSWRLNEIEYIYDNNPQTTWWGHRMTWHDKPYESITIDLGKIKNVNRLVWVNWSRFLTPTNYQISVSKDKKIWKKVSESNNPDEKKDQEIIVDEFNPEEARFVKMDIFRTYSGDSPSISEIEVVETKFADVDITKAYSFLTTDFTGPIDFKNYQLFNISAQVKTNDGKGYKNSISPIKSLNKFEEYEFIIDPGGTEILDVKFAPPNSAVKLDVDGYELKNLSIEEIQKRGLIKEIREVQ